MGAVARAASKDVTKPAPPTATYAYKTVGDCTIRADVYFSEVVKGSRPVIVSIHGGALIMGGRRSIQMDLFKPLIDKGFAVVSIDYRLAPETKLPEIIKDVQDAFAWVREKGPELFGADKERIGVQGGSAGGYLTLMAGICITPRPKVLASFYGYGDIIGDWYSKPDPFYCAQPAVSKEVAYNTVGGNVLCEEPQKHRRHQFYLYCRQNGLWPKEVAGFDPATEAAAFKPYCPVQNVTAEYPPTLLAHGDKDTDVPYEQSKLMDAALTKAGVVHEFITLENAGHGFSQAPRNEYKAAIARTRDFLEQHLRKQ